MLINDREGSEVNLVFNIRDNIEKPMYFAWFCFFVVNTVFGQYHTQSLRVILAATMIYLFSRAISNDNAYFGITRIPICSLWLIVFAAYVHLSVFWQTAPANSADVLKFLEFDCITIICLEAFFSSKERVKNLMIIFDLAMAVYGMVILATMPLSDWGSDWNFGGITNVNRNAASYIFVICFAISIYLYEMIRNKIFLLLVPFFVVMNLSTGSRKGIIQMVLVVFLYVFLLGDLKRKLKMIGVLLFLVVLFFVLYNTVPYLQETYGERLLAVFDDSIYDGSIMIRTIFRENAFAAFWESPIIGNGVNYSVALNRQTTGYALYSHCNYAELLCNYGLIGAGLYYVMYLRAMYLSVVNRATSFGRLGLSVIISLLVIEYGQITYYIMAGTIPIYVIMIMAVYGEKDAVNE